MSTETSLSPGARQLWRAARTPLAIGLVVLLAALVAAVAVGTGNRGLLDPDGVDGSGSRALAELLRDEGVDVRVARTTAEALRGDGTLFVPLPGRLRESQLADIREGARHIVVVAPDEDALRVLAPGVRPVLGAGAVQRTEPRCALPEATAAGAAELGGDAYRTSSAVAGELARCYPTDGGPSLVRVTGQGRTVTVVGTPEPFRNDRLDRQGNAALTMNLLGGDPDLVWYLPRPEPVPDGQQRSLVDLIPAGWGWAAAQLAVAVVLVAAWRARRLGPVVSERLPVVVRAAETVEGQARLYRRARAREHAADTLRTACRARLIVMLGLAPTAEPAAVIAAVAARTGRSAVEIGDVLYGAAPGDDAALTELARSLDAVEEGIRRS